MKLVTNKKIVSDLLAEVLLEYSILEANPFAAAEKDEGGGEEAGGDAKAEGGEEKEKADAQLALPDPEETRPIWQTSLHFFILVAILVFANWGKPGNDSGFWYFMYEAKWIITSLFAVGLIKKQKKKKKEIY